MFSKILGNNNSKESSSTQNNADLISKILKMNLTDMKMYVNNRMDDFEITEDGIMEVMKRLVLQKMKVKYT